jgi:1-acyl-sn-glycerol-3-phosphate acyltransferase
VIHHVFTLLSLLPARPRRATVRWLMNTVWDRRTTLEVTGQDTLPEGPCLFICNHLSNADGFTLDRALRPRRVYFLAGVKLRDTVMTRLATEVVHTIFLRPNAAEAEPLKRSVEVLKQGHSVLIFPEGGRSRGGALLRAKPGVALIARRARVPIVPVALTGTEHFMPIDDRHMGREKVLRAHLTVRLGSPFLIEQLLAETEGAEDARQGLADAMMRRVAALLPPAYQGVYALPEAGTPQADLAPAPPPPQSADR